MRKKHYDSKRFNAVLDYLLKREEYDLTITA